MGIYHELQFLQQLAMICSYSSLRASGDELCLTRIPIPIPIHIQTKQASFTPYCGIILAMLARLGLPQSRAVWCVLGSMQMQPWHLQVRMENIRQ